MVIDREYWGFVVALITNMESSALGSFLCFSTSLHPLVLYCTLRPSSRCLISRVRNNIFFCCFFFSLFDTFVWLFHLSNALFFSVFVSRTSWRLGDKEERAREKEQWRVYCGGISDYWATDRLNQSGGRGGWVSTDKHTLKNPIENQPRKEPD